MELFDASDLTNYVGNFENALTSTSPELPKSRKSTSGCFTIYYHNTPLRYDNNHTILFKIDEGKRNIKRVK
uniref:Uncharacterized protein n=1 Tax=Panagrolaimus sp. ES5 TaxID=591445 RepID=A0AC34G1D7_9BILA